MNNICKITRDCIFLQKILIQFNQSFSLLSLKNDMRTWETFSFFDYILFQRRSYCGYVLFRILCKVAENTRLYPVITSMFMLQRRGCTKVGIVHMSKLLGSYKVTKINCVFLFNCSGKLTSSIEKSKWFNEHLFPHCLLHFWYIYVYHILIHMFLKVFKHFFTFI